MRQSTTNRVAMTLFALSVFGASVPSFALTGNDLYAALNDERATSVSQYIQGVLDGYVVGAIDIGILASIDAVKEGRRLNGVALAQRRQYCVEFSGTQVNAQQLSNVVKKFLFENPRLRNEQAFSLILQAVSRDYPCK